MESDCSSKEATLLFMDEIWIGSTAAAAAEYRVRRPQEEEFNSLSKEDYGRATAADGYLIAEIKWRKRAD